MRTAPSVGKDLHDGYSPWHDSPVRDIRIARPRSREHADILVVGAGITGALVALSLSEAGYNVTVVDRSTPGQGSTLASTAMIQFEIDTPLHVLARKIGERQSRRVYRRSAEAVQQLGSMIRRHNLQADWRPRDSLYLAGNKHGPRGLRLEVTARRAIRLDSEYLTGKELEERFGVRAKGAILSSGSAELDPARTTAECLRAAQRLGARILSPCTVVSAESMGKQEVRLHTAQRGIIDCRRVVFATGYQPVLGLPRRFEIVSSWAIATKPVPRSSLWPGRALIWEAADPYLYARTTANNQIIAGGEDSGLTAPSRRTVAIPNKARRILAKLGRILDRDDLELAYAWAGAFAITPTGLPIIQELDDLPTAFAILGAGGNGITFSMVACDLVKGWLRGIQDPDAPLFQARGNR